MPSAMYNLSKISLRNVVERVEVGSPELLLSPLLSLHSTSIKLRYSKRDFVADVLVKDAEQSDRN